MRAVKKKPLYRQQAPPPVPERFDELVLLVRGQRVMLDSDLAALYGVLTKVLNQAVQRNEDRFPADFMFQLTEEEAVRLRSQFVTLNPNASQKFAGKPLKTANPADSLRSQIVTLKRGQHRKFLPYVFTEQGVAMLSSVLRSPRAVKINIEIMRVFVRLRQLLASHTDLERRLTELEEKSDRKFKAVFEAIRELLERPDPLQPDHGREIGFHSVQQLKEDAPPYRCFPRKAESKS